MGDYIIVDSIRRILEKHLPSSIFISVATHDYLSSEAYKVIAKSDLTIVCGTNLLCGNLEHYKQWKIQARDFLLLRDVVLMGVGWWQYQKQISEYTKEFYNLCLSRDMPHSVRDQYTFEMLSKSAQNRRILNTACPTMWGLNNAHTELINQAAKTKAKICVTTVTDYKAHEPRDIEMITSLMNAYECVYVWIQGAGDLNYLKSIEHKLPQKLTYISPTLSAYDRFLDKTDRLDFIGTRLHAGIRALQWGHPATIVEVDNRAKEIANDTGLPTWPRDKDFSLLVDRHISQYNISLRLPQNEINQWLASLKEMAYK